MEEEGKSSSESEEEAKNSSESEEEGAKSLPKTEEEEEGKSSPERTYEESKKTLNKLRELTAQFSAHIKKTEEAKSIALGFVKAGGLSHSKDFNCPMCKEKFSSPALHMEKEHPEYIKECALCKCPVRGIPDYRIHIEMAHPELIKK